MPFPEGIVLGNIPQSEEDMVFGVQDLRKGCACGVHEEFSSGYVRDRVSEGNMVSSAFTVWQGEGAERKGRFVVNLKRQSKHWPRGSVKIETIKGVTLDLQKNDYLMSWDIQSDYRHFYLYLSMRDMFMFRYGEKYYRCLALPFG